MVCKILNLGWDEPGHVWTAAYSTVIFRYIRQKALLSASDLSFRLTWGHMGYSNSIVLSSRRWWAIPDTAPRGSEERHIIGYILFYLWSLSSKHPFNVKEIQEGVTICICMAYSLCCTVETLSSKYTPIKFHLKTNKQNSSHSKFPGDKPHNMVLNLCSWLQKIH